MVPVDQVAEDEMILDAGPATVALVKEKLKGAKTVVWNGPFGAFELPPFDAATVAVAKAVAEATKAGALLSVAGGGDTVAALNHAGAAGDFSYVSTAGGAFLEWLEGKQLAGGRSAAALRPRCYTQPIKCRHRPQGRLQGDRQTMNAELETIAQKMVSDGKGILAADESTSTIKKRFDAIGVESTEENRRDYRELLFRSDEAMKEYISGVILFDETLRQKAKDGTPLVSLIQQAGSIPASRWTPVPSPWRCSRRDHHGRPRRPRRPPEGVLRPRRPLREVARGDRYRRRHPHPPVPLPPTRTPWPAMRPCARKPTSSRSSSRKYSWTATTASSAATK